MGRADRARRERPSRRLKRRPRPTAGPDAPSSPSFFARLARLAPAAGLPWACLALALALSGALPSPAQAQTNVTLVSNFDSASSSVGTSVGESGSSVLVTGQQFTTGTNTQGYVLKTLTFSINILVASVSLKASIYTSVNDKPGTELYSFASPSGTGEKTIAAQAGATLTANTSYFVVFEDTDTALGRGVVSLSTSSTSYDTDSLTDWSLVGQISSSDGGTTWGSISTTDKLAIKLVGEVVATTTNTAATGQPDITGTPAVGQTLTAVEGDMADDDGLPTFPTDYTFQWVRVDGGMDTPIGTGQTYTPVADDVGKTLKVEVSFTDDRGTTETLTSEPTAAVLAQPTDCPVDADWCATLAVGVLLSSTGYIDADSGVLLRVDIGALSDTDFTYADTDFEVWQLFLDAGANPTLHLEFNPPGETVLGGAGAVLNVGGETFNLVDATFDSGEGQFEWANSGLSWSEGDTVTVSLNFPPALVSATVDGASLVLTYHEDLDTGSTPPASAYAVTVAGSTVSVSGVSVSGKTVTLTLATAAASGETVTVSYTVPASNPVQDESGLKAPAFASTDHTVTNNTATTTSAVLKKLVVREEPDGTVAKNTFIPPRGTYTPRLEQTASVSHDTETVTIIAEGEEPNATIEYRRADGGAIIEDADPNKDHHQVELWSYANPMEITLTPTVGSDTVSETYTLRIRRAGSTTQEAATGKPVISGEPRVGETLTVKTNKVTDANGTYRAETGFLQHEFRVNWHVVDEDPDRNITEIIGTGKTITLNENHKGKLLYVNMVFKDDLGNDESVTSETTDRVKGYELVISTTGGRLTGSRCDYVYPAGVHCDGETTPRDVGEPLTVLSEGGADMADWVTAFHIENPTTVGVFDEYGNEQEASYEFEITPSGQVRTVQGRTYPHFEFPYCEPVSGVCRTSKNAFKFFTLTSVDVKVTVETFDGRIGKGSFPVWVVAHPNARSVTGTETSNRRCGKNNNWRCYGRMLVDGQQMYGPVVKSTVPKSTVPRSQALSASFEDAPARHDGQSSFKLSLVFSEAPHERNNKDLKNIISVRNGTVTKVRRIDKDNARRRLTIEPNGNAAVHVSVPRTTDCAAANALCTAAGGRLETGASITVPAGPQASVPSVAPLTVEFTNAPVEHDGSSEFTFEIVFSERPDGVDNEDIRAALAVSGGTKTGLRRVDGDYTHRRAKVRPDGYGAVTATLPATGDCADANALCTAAGGKLETPVTVTVEGPVAISVADARVEEADGAELVFAVTLDRARHATVKVDYATEDGSADVDDDYTETEGTLTFAAGETSKEVEVLVRDDAHDEGEETVLLRLSNPVGARIADGEATGTIENTDHMPKAWLGRFGRTVADQVLDAVEGRMRAPRAPGAEVRLAGQRLGLGPVYGTEAAAEGGEEAAALRARESEAEAAQAGRRLAAWLSGAADEADRSGVETRTVTQRALLLGTSFSLTAGAAEGAGGSASLWGRSAVSRFDGREGELSLDGEVASGLLGADWTRGRSTAGLVVSHSRGEGGYRASSRSERHFEASSRSERNPGEGGAGTVSSTLTGLYPWGRHALSERVSVWGVAGYGEGTLTLRPENEDGTAQAAIRTDTDLVMGAVGVRGVAVAAPSDGGVELSVTGDALGVRTTSDAVRGGAGNLAATEADVTRVRLGLEGSVARPRGRHGDAGAAAGARGAP